MSDSSKQSYAPPYDGLDAPMRVVVACRDGVGCVLYATGEHWVWWHSGVGNYRLAPHGLDDAPDGISVWEGHIDSWGPDRNGEYDAEPRGVYRTPTTEEWMAIIGGYSPFSCDKT
jgi:hypothetical protein